MVWWPVIARKIKVNSIVTKDLTKKYKNFTSVDNLNLEIKKGELFGLLGVNGAGKTTTIKMLTGLAQPTSGKGSINDHDIIKDRNIIKSIIGVCPQETAIADNLTVKENLELMCGIHEFSKEEIQDKTNSLLKYFRLEDIKEMKSQHLSGGYKRRLSIAMALIGEPQVLFLDEPSLGLDVISRSELWEIIKSLKKKLTIILTTHYMEEAEYLADRVGIMKDGKMIVTGSVDEIKNISGKNTFVDAFISLTKEEK